MKRTGDMNFAIGTMTETLKLTDEMRKDRRDLRAQLRMLVDAHLKSTEGHHLGDSPEGMAMADRLLSEELARARTLLSRIKP